MDYPIQLDLGGGFYQRLQELLGSHGILLSAAEFHGCLSGLACAGRNEFSIVRWQRVIVSDLDQTNACGAIGDAMAALIALIRRDLQSSGFEFQILLPP